MVCLVGDRDLSASGVRVRFMDEATRMPAGPAALAVQTGAALLPVTLWYDGTPVMQGRVHPEIEVPAEGGRREKIAAMTQALADVWAEAIREHPQDWHMLQRFWLADLPGGDREAPAEEGA
jgi:KDO2-lipid IV(A) lauroyltransferase